MAATGSGKSHRNGSGRGRSESTRTSRSIGSSNSSRPSKKGHDSVDAESVLMLGPPGVGKRTILAKWTDQRRIAGRRDGVLPSGFGIRVRPLASGANLYTVLGMDSARLLARLSKNLCGDVKVLLYVLDAMNEMQIERARCELHELTKFDVFKFCRVVVAANRRDGHGRPFTRLELMGRSMLNTDALKQQVTIIEVNALSGEGLRELYHGIARQHVATVGSPTRKLANDKHSGRDVNAGKNQRFGGAGPPRLSPTAERCESGDSYRGASQDSHFSGHAVIGDEGSPLSSRNRR